MSKFNVPRFVKWAGGKQQLLEQFEPLFPKKFNRYFEPFVGSGAVAIYMLQKYPDKEFYLSDINEDLINAYKVIQSNVEPLIDLLKKHKEEYTKDPIEYYYKIRSMEISPLNNIENAARFIFLNRTCFNGLYRVNKAGRFNVPIGRYKNPDIVQEEKLKLISKLIKNVKFKVMNYQEVLNLAEEGDFVYFDPPYHPLNGSSFTTYTKGNFLEEDQRKLAELFDDMSKKGIKCMLSNSDTELINIEYTKFKLKKVEARRAINSIASKRGKINEILVTNY